ncbi:MAG: sigma-70 family RNA polymerase sigma factor [Sandaracinus sp.]
MSTPSDPVPALARTLRTSWQRFLDVYEPLRPDLYRYCRYLTRSPWDAEDLAQDTLARAFVTLGQIVEPPASPRAWLFRVASNLWIDRARRPREHAAQARDVPILDSDPRAAREAAGTLLGQLTPRERAAVVLKEVFDLSLEEIGETLGTTPNTIKSALHRGRGKLAEAETVPGAAPAPALLDAFCAAFNAHDLDRVTALLLETASVEVVGATREYGRQAARARVLPGMMFGSRRLADPSAECGVERQYRTGALPTPVRAELRSFRGEPVLLSWYAHVDGEAVRGITRLSHDEERITHVANYFYTPDLLADVCRELEVPFRINGYAYWRGQP